MIILAYIYLRENMIPHFRDYFWKMGKPIGKDRVTPQEALYSYKIVPDPYHRRFSIEKYEYEKFKEVIYDSFLLDFRKLKEMESTRWQKEFLSEDKSILRDPDDRFVLIEKYAFENEKCRSCEIYSIHGIKVATHKLYYELFQDQFNGIILFDLEGKPVMIKKYELDIIGDFGELIFENWDDPKICVK